MDRHVRTFKENNKNSCINLIKFLMKKMNFNSRLIKKQKKFKTEIDYIKETRKIHPTVSSMFKLINRKVKYHS